MNNRLLFFVLPALAALFFLLKVGFSDRPDPEWRASANLISTDFYTLEEAADSLQILYENFQGKKSPDSLAAFKIMSSPALPTMAFSKFKNLFERVCKQRSAVISAVSGMGTTTLANRFARLIATRPDNLLTINCAPQFDLELHKTYIGHAENGVWKPGFLMNLWEKAIERPDEKFVCLLDNLDKINPETFFGPDLWELLSDSKHVVEFGGKRVVVPPNFYLLSVTHLGEGNKIELSNEQFKRLGSQIVQEVSPDELVINLQGKRRELLANPARDEKGNAQLAALSDSQNLQRLVFFFSKTNRMVAEKLSADFQLGWTNVRKLYLPGDLPAIKNVFLSSVNGLHPKEPLMEKDFATIDYALKTGGLLKNSSPILSQVEWLRDLGFLTEFTVLGLTALATALGTWLLFRRSRRLLQAFSRRVNETFQQFENQQLTVESACEKLGEIRHELNELVLSRKLSFNEGVYFLNQIDDQMRRIEIARSTSENFLQLMEMFLEDNLLTDGEYQKLIQFLDSVRHKIPAADWGRYRNDVEEIYQKNKNSA